MKQIWPSWTVLAGGEHIADCLCCRTLLIAARRGGDAYALVFRRRATCNFVWLQRRDTRLFSSTPRNTNTLEKALIGTLNRTRSGEAILANRQYSSNRQPQLDSPLNGREATSLSTPITTYRLIVTQRLRKTRTRDGISLGWYRPGRVVPLSEAKSILEAQTSPPIYKNVDIAHV